LTEGKVNKAGRRREMLLCYVLLVGFLLPSTFSPPPAWGSISPEQQFLSWEEVFSFPHIDRTSFT
jgi:hypothetical protein